LTCPGYFPEIRSSRNIDIEENLLIAGRKRLKKMDLYILRHGKAGHSSSDPEDDQRALTPAGRKEIREIARWLQAEKIPFDLIASSPLRRASETARIVAKTLGLEEKVVSWDDLAPGGDPDSVCYAASQSEKSTILIIGHEPDLSLLIGKIISQGETASVTVTKGGLAKIRYFAFDDRHPSGVLQWLLTAKQIQAMR
jgi:phosphohistidine phosphatase